MEIISFILFIDLNAKNLEPSKIINKSLGITHHIKLFSYF